VSSAPFGFQPSSSLVVARQVRMAGSEFQLRIFGAGSVLEQPNRVKRVHSAMFAAGSGCAACGPVATMPCGNFLSAGKIHKFAQYANLAAGVLFYP